MHELGLSPFVWVLFVMLFVFNGHVTAHLWGSATFSGYYYLIPWVLLCVLRAAREDYSSEIPILASTLAGMI